MTCPQYWYHFSSSHCRHSCFKRKWPLHQVTVHDWKIILKCSMLYITQYPILKTLFVLISKLKKQYFNLIRIPI